MSGLTVCEAKRLCDDEPCQHPAKYLAPFDCLAVCGIHRRGFLRCIPLSEFVAAGIPSEGERA